MKPWLDETKSMRIRLCLWLATHDNEFTTADARKALNLGIENKRCKQAISEMKSEEKLTIGHHRGMLRLYKKVPGMKYEDLTPRLTKADMAAKSVEKADSHKPKHAPGIKGVTVHLLGW